MMAVLRKLRHNPKATLGLGIVLIFVIMAIAAPILAPFDPLQRVARPHQPPSLDHLLGTTRLGRDVLSQLIYGARASLAVGLATGFVITFVGTLVGVVGGYFGGRFGGALEFITNMILVIPNLPLLIVLAAFVGHAGPLVIALIVGFTSWGWGARVTRAQTLAVRQKDFVRAAELLGEARWRIVAAEIMPNLVSIVGINFVGSIIYAVIAETTLEFLGFANIGSVSWGTMLYNAQNASAITVGAWWDELTPCAAIALLGTGLALLNFTLDEVSNPQLKTGSVVTRWLRLTRLRQRALEAGA